MSDSPVSKLLDHLLKPMARVDDLILQHMQSEIPLIPEIGKHIVSSGGKRVRPLITLAAAELGSAKDMEKASQLAAAVEFIHTATLLHDDVVDESDLRRGNASANNVWGNKAPVLVGDFLFSKAFELMVGVSRLDVLSVLSSASARIAEGEVYQLRTTRDLTTTTEEYEIVIASKTAALFEAAMEVGGLVSDTSLDRVNALKAYGYELGLAFQMVDDALDYSASPQDMGKATGDDFREGKLTLPLILAFEAGNSEQKSFWRRTIRDLKQKDGDLEVAVSYLTLHDSVNSTLKRAKEAGDRAKSAISEFEDSPIKAHLINLIDFVVNRSH